MIENKKSQALIKRDIYENWEKSFGKYIPYENIIIIIDMPDGTIQLKIGDGITLIEDLPNILENKYNSNHNFINASVDEEVLKL